MSKINFTCPQCSHNKVEEVLASVTVASEINVINDNGELDYGEQTNCGGYVDCYQCSNCGLNIENATDGPELVVAIENMNEQKRRDEKNGLYCEKIDPAN